MADFFRNTTLGAAVRLLSHDKYLSFAVDTNKNSSNGETRSATGLNSPRNGNKYESMAEVEVDWYAFVTNWCIRS